ncbi:MAG: hypothetical protein C0602_11110 [Denitrovibrio sp.]|nr:MAG: hypothetical protein C0602_11110 [Denitrovibrio sp.]
MRLFAFIFIFMVSFSAFAADMPSVNLDGLMKEVKSHDGKTMVIFWAPWCPWCLKELKVIRDNPKFVSDNNLQIIGITKLNDKGKAENLVEHEKMPFRFIIGEKDIYDKLQRIDAVPLTIVYSNKGEQLDLEYGKQSIEDLNLMVEDY